MVTFKLSKVEFLQQSRGYSSVIKVQVSNIDNDECSSIPWDEFQVSQIYLNRYNIKNIYICYAVIIQLRSF